MTAETTSGARRLYVRGTGVALPAGRHTIADAVAAGLYDGERAARDGFTSVAVEPDLFPLDLALRAARDATGDVDPDEISSLAFTSIHRHGHKTLWPPASYLHRELGLRSDAVAFALNQGCNGAFVAMTMAERYLRDEPEGSALVVGADRYEETLFDRWNSDHGTVYGDGASAVLLSRVPGPLEVLHLDVEQGTALERMYRFDRPAPEGDGTARDDYDVGAAKRSYLAEYGSDGVGEVFGGVLGRLRAKLLAAYPLDREPVAHVVYPNVGAGVSAGFYVRAFGDLAERNAWDFGRTIGHTGVSDQMIGLVHLLESGLLNPGERVLLIGAGNGLSAATMLLEYKK